jgi:alkaline phosphatase D
MKLIVTFALALGLLSSPRTMGATKLTQAGPMIGHVGQDEARVWIRVKADSVVTAALRQEDRTFRPSRIEDLKSGFQVLHFQSLQPATPCTVQIDVSRGTAALETSSVSFQTAPLPSAIGKVRVAFGSCSKVSQYKSGPIYRAIAEEHPDMTLLVGDNSYFIVGDGGEKHFETSGPVGDWTSQEGMLHRHLITRVHPDLQTMFRTVPTYAIWDDHDYGPNNADRTFSLREEATTAFRQMWANPSWGTAEIPGTFSSFRHGPAEIFLMDDRYYKYSPQEHDDVTPETGSIWGEAQLEWLIEGLKASTAPVKLIANGTQVLSKSKGGEGHYREAATEIYRLLSTISTYKIGGVVFLTGDRHFSEAMQQKLPDGPLVVDCTSSPLQQNQKVGPVEGKEHENQIWAMRGNNFGLITIDIPSPGKGSLRFETRDESNKLCVVNEKPCATTWELTDLSF